MKIDGGLYVIVDPKFTKDAQHSPNIFDLTLKALKGGADIIQLRDKTSATGKLLEQAIQLKKICAKFKKLFIVNDRTDIAILSYADGVHLGKEDISIKDARKLLGKNKIIGATAHNIMEAKNAVRHGADYIGYGHIFPTSSKDKKDKPKGLKVLRKIVCELQPKRLSPKGKQAGAWERDILTNSKLITVFAIGGIDSTNARSVMKTGVHGIAVISALSNSKNPVKAAKDLHDIVRQWSY